MPILDPIVLSEVKKFNETEVRFHVVDPIIRALGYPVREGTFLRLEEKLEYPYYHIGHKSKKDLPLGFPDYRAGVKGRRGCFVIEAKAGGHTLSKTDVEQVHSYAAHALVGANYFVLCNGELFQIFQTLSGSNSAPILELYVSDIEENFFKIENILSPEKLVENCHVDHDTKLKLADGLGSEANVVSGKHDAAAMHYRIMVGGNDITEIAKSMVPQISEFDDLIEQLKGYQYAIERGSILRNYEGRIIAELQFSPITKNNAVNMKMLGVERMEFMSSDEFLSTRPETPSIFESEAGFQLSKGTPIFPLFGEATPITDDLSVDVFVSARMYLADKTIRGFYAAYAIYSMDVSPVGLVNFELEVMGEFEGLLI
ncbi:type I restriction enzyme HsdR N-terminal domain-containing protein [Hoeflea poritis]|uniref:Type I restriction enzyme HsdR N-terminal domain-containing protein n=1 Tax=Hoeflea poritis TaxID=2993659 RepID=A0ABT4VS60_9HYPH|nr:type I restriction enzyme HsdR N-terminal domain-containing protein [Hoeflea poritis]MDA4847035.1 type I restriction enzyme HsdR N-terminal domain-containing protein [Hoeflea poritis]